MALYIGNYSNKDLIIPKKFMQFFQDLKVNMEIVMVEKVGPCSQFYMDLQLNHMDLEIWKL
jgi:hypothetical protein